MLAPHLFMAAESGGLLGALGVNLRALVLNTLALLAVAYILGRFVFPSLIQALDAKRDEWAAAERAKREAEAARTSANDQAAVVLAQARERAEALTGAAQREASELVAAARERAAAEAERIAAEAGEQLRRDVQTARTQLRAETAELVRRAAGTVLHEELTAPKDAALIRRSLEEVR